MTSFPLPPHEDQDGPIFRSCDGRYTVLNWCTVGWGLSVRCREPGCGLRRTYSTDDLIERLAGALGATMFMVARHMVCMHCRSQRLDLSNFECVHLPNGHEYKRLIKERRRTVVARAAAVVAKKQKADPDVQPLLDEQGPG